MPNPYSGGNIAQLLRYQGANRAQAIGQQGAIWGQGVQNLGSIASETIKGMLQAKESEKGAALRKLQEEEAIRQIRGTQAERMEMEEQSAWGVPFSPEETQRRLTEKGFPDVGKRAADTARTEAERARARVFEGVNQFKTGAGKVAELTRQTQLDPASWGKNRPLVMDIVNQFAPQIAKEIPEAYDADKVNGLFDMATASASYMDQKHAELTAIQDLAARGSATLNLAQQEPQWMDVVGKYLVGSKSQADLDANKEHALAVGAPKEILAKFPDWTADFDKQLAEVLKTPEARAAEQARRETSAGTLADAIRRKQGELKRDLNFEETKAVAKEFAEMGRSGSTGHPAGPVVARNSQQARDRAIEMLTELSREKGKNYVTESNIELVLESADNRKQLNID